MSIAHSSRVLAGAFHSQQKNNRSLSARVLKTAACIGLALSSRGAYASLQP
jgi:hypothetical protein